jgi:hypothetical protein
VKDISKPSRKIIILAVIAAVFITALLVNKFWKRGGEVEPLQNIAFATEASSGGVNNLVTTDKNEDGTPDWKEMLLAEAGSDAASSTENAPKTLSEGVARSLFASTVYLSNNGQNEIPEQDKEALVNNLITQLQDSITYKQYQLAGLKTTGGDQAVIRSYASRFATLQVGMILVMQKNITAIQSDIGVMAKIYAKEAEDLYALETPQELAETHLAIVNNFSRAAAAFEAFAHEKDDPIKLPFAIQSYQSASVEQTTLLTKVAQFISLNGIIFTSNEIGGYWNAFAETQ